MSNYPIYVTKFQIMELSEPVGLCTNTSTPLGGVCSGFKFPKTLCPAGKKIYGIIAEEMLLILLHLDFQLF